MKTRSLLASLIASLALLAMIAPASAKPKGFQTGTYTTTGDIAFQFTVKKGSCPTATGGKAKKGYCFSGFGDPQHVMDCPAGAGFQPDYSDYITFPYNARIPTNGKVTAKLYSYFSNDEIAGTTYFNIKIDRKGKATGSVTKESVTTWGTPATCTTGPLRFKAKLSGR